MLMLLCPLAASVAIGMRDWFLPALVLSFVWISFCISSVLWRPTLLLRRDGVRKPTESEQLILELAIINLGNQKFVPRRSRYRINIMEDPEIRAFATGFRIVCISTGALEQLSILQIGTLLLHQVGRLHSFDTTCSSVFNTAFDYTTWFQVACDTVLRRFKTAPLFLSISFCISVAVTLHIHPWELFRFTLAAAILHYGILLINSFFSRHWHRSIVNAEYRQDRFVTSLGYAQPLIEILLLIGDCEKRICRINIQNKIVH